ncbi:hypothetical protein PHOBOS_31 [Erwinia phage vB_EamM_Phobos]|uniref:hypothetical protein n=1 Tax=Erwinia phage vB_EamM_Phobos TaxID=1883377 RepID=UPI00081C71F5|nr:hypothetical protein BIZ79_gp031 [Erwinia phage vB_EamM_Phobos]ANZ50221.1 hypothetical protein PHOBOS_31 [Erwinia phage vB_EamM_Phobos]
MNFNMKFLKDRSLMPKTKPDARGQQKSLTIEPNLFNDECESLTLKYFFGKGEGLYPSAKVGTLRAMCDALEDALRNKEASKLEFEITNSQNKPPAVIVIGRGEDLIPFIGLSGDVNGQKKSQKFMWYADKGVRLLRNGQPVPDLEVHERMTRTFVKEFDIFIRALESVYNPKEWNNNAGGSYGGGNKGGSYGGGQQRSYGANNGGGQQAPAGGGASMSTAVNEYDEMF